MSNRPGLSAESSPARREQKTGSPSNRGRQHQTTDACSSISALTRPLPTSARSSEVTGVFAARDSPMQPTKSSANRKWPPILDASGSRMPHYVMMPKTLRPAFRLAPTAIGAAGLLATLFLPPMSFTAAGQTRVQPILGFPEAGLDDPAAYQGYQTRFYRDTKGNVVQIYLDASRGRVVNLLADAV